jgi:uncharacterized protein (TIGR00369 family)
VTYHFEPQDPDFERRGRAGFASQTVMATIGASIVRVVPGEVDVALPYRADLAQQNGFLHAGIVTAIVDTACGFAAYSLMPPGYDVLTVEYKVNFLAPAQGALFLARGRVVKPGRTLTVCTGEVVAFNEDGSERPVATMLATMMGLRARPSEDV